MDLGELTDDALTGGFRLWQRRRGHRYSLDDTVTAWEAARRCPGATRCLDLGCGIGSVLLMLAYKLPNARFTGIEAQAQSFELLGRNVERNGVAARATLLYGDLRDPDMLCRAVAGFDLITGTPPYQPLGQGTVSPDSQRAHARVELRGGVEDYLRVAGQLVADDGWVVLCGDSRRPERVDAGAADVALVVRSRRDVVPAARIKGPLFSVWTLQRDDGSELPPRIEKTFHARDADGARTADVRELRAFFDLPMGDREPPSPRTRRRQQGVRESG